MSRYSVGDVLVEGMLYLSVSRKAREGDLYLIVRTPDRDGRFYHVCEFHEFVAGGLPMSLEAESLEDESVSHLRLLGRVEDFACAPARNAV